MKRVLLFLTVASLAITSCSKEKEGCNDKRASNYDENVVVDDGSCIYTDVTFYADSSHVNGVAISSIDVKIDGVVVGSFNGYFTSEISVCGATNTAVYKSKGESSVSWTATINQLGGGSITRSGEYSGITTESCVIQQVLP